MSLLSDGDILYPFEEAAKRELKLIMEVNSSGLLHFTACLKNR